MSLSLVASGLSFAILLISRPIQSILRSAVFLSNGSSTVEGAMGPVAAVTAFDVVAACGFVAFVSVVLVCVAVSAVLKSGCIVFLSGDLRFVLTFLSGTVGCVPSPVTGIVAPGSVSAVPLATAALFVLSVPGLLRGSADSLPVRAVLRGLPTAASAPSADFRGLPSTGRSPLDLEGAAVTSLALPVLSVAVAAVGRLLPLVPVAGTVVAVWSLVLVFEGDVEAAVSPVFRTVTGARVLVVAVVSIVALVPDLVVTGAIVANSVSAPVAEERQGSSAASSSILQIEP